MSSPWRHGTGCCGRRVLVPIFLLCYCKRSGARTQRLFLWILVSDGFNINPPLLENHTRLARKRWFCLLDTCRADEIMWIVDKHGLAVIEAPLQLSAECKDGAKQVLSGR